MSFLPVEVGVPNGASAVNSLRSTSATAAVGFDTSKSSVADAETRLFVIQLRREEWVDGRELLFDTTFADNAVQVAAAKLADTSTSKDRGFMIRPLHSWMIADCWCRLQAV